MLHFVMDDFVGLEFVLWDGNMTSCKLFPALSHLSLGLVDRTSFTVHWNLNFTSNQLETGSKKYSMANNFATAPFYFVFKSFHQ